MLWLLNIYILSMLTFVCFEFPSAEACFCSLNLLLWYRLAPQLQSLSRRELFPRLSPTCYQQRMPRGAARLGSSLKRAALGTSLTSLHNGFIYSGKYSSGDRRIIPCRRAWHLASLDLP